MLKILSVLFVSSALFLTGCASTQPVGGLLFSDVRGPVSATSAVKGTAKGEACAASYLGFVGLGDASISAAMKKGRLSSISHVEQHSTNILGFYMKYCTIVWGNKGAGGPAAPASKKGGDDEEMSEE